jgi:histidinol-phosphate phosphatase family protein
LSNTVPRSNLKKTRAVFLDRDGVINREVGILSSVQQLTILPKAAAAIAAINKLGFLVVVATNQPVIARGLISEPELDAIHAVMVSRLARHGAKIDAIYYCPHHPDANLKKYRVRCRCRKPNIGLIMRAVKEHGIALDKSFLIGDRTVDIVAGKKARVRTILVRTGFGGKDGKFDVAPDFTAKDLGAAVRIIKKYAK